MICCGLAVWSGACASGPLSALRFDNRAPVWEVADRAPIPKPAEREPLPLRDHLAAQYVDPLLYGLDNSGPRLATNINSLGEVPDSTWFKNRIGVRELTAGEVARGPNGPGPDLSAPLVILSVKAHGAAPGFLVRDARGDRFFIKFDPLGTEEETSTDVVVQRLLWASGYNVPENSVIHLRRDDLVLAPDAVESQSFGEDRPLSERDVDEVLAQVPGRVEGAPMRALASKFLNGIPVGGYPMEGTRADDPNDRVPHEDRRDLRGQAVFFSWLGHTDVREANTLDVWVENAPDSERGYLMHYLIDFGKALGVWRLANRCEYCEWAYHTDYGYALASLLSFGLWKRPWEGLTQPPLRGVGRYDAANFDPASYVPGNAYKPFLRMDRRDAYWAAKIVMRFRREHVVAAVAQGEYSDPAARRYLVDTILARGRKLARHWFARVNPIEDFVVQHGGQGLRLCARDLALAYGLAQPSTTRYRLEAYDWRGRRLGWRRERIGASGGRLCAAGLPVGESHDGYTMVVYRTLRGDDALPPTIVHLANDPAGGGLRVIGIERR